MVTNGVDIDGRLGRFSRNLYQMCTIVFEVYDDETSLLRTPLGAVENVSLLEKSVLIAGVVFCLLCWDH